MKWKSCREFPKKHGWYIAKAVHDSDKPFIRVIKPIFGVKFVIDND